ncbi:MAG: agmatine deiminase family protein, partial [Alloprevotella sp.]|nr:agmatine deiminase family protein [Alloprevotella sp.]
MGIFTLPPKPPRADLDVESFLRSDSTQSPVRRFHRTLAAEWFPQSGVQLTWPHAGTDWASMLSEVTDTYIRMAYEIATREQLLIVTPEPEKVRTLLTNRLPRRATERIIYATCETDDTWARDHGFLTVIGTGQPELLDFQFNGWGGKFAAQHDNAINYHLHEAGLVRGQYV